MVKATFKEMIRDKEKIILIPILFSVYSSPSCPDYCESGHLLDAGLHNFTQNLHHFLPQSTSLEKSDLFFYVIRVELLTMYGTLVNNLDYCVYIFNHLFIENNFKASSLVSHLICVI